MMSSGPRHCRRSIRRGYSLAFFVMILFAILALAALVIDLGLARVTSASMKNATESGALEVLSHLDVAPGNPSTYANRDTTTLAAARLQGVTRMAETFNDDLDPNTASSSTLGAGPRIGFSGGVELNDGFQASQTLSLDEPRVYRPEPALNLDNRVDGDVVLDATGVLTRLRRDGAGDDPGYRSDGGPVPYLFGLGTLMSSERKATGIPLTIESRAELHPTVRVGIKRVVGGVTLAGAIPFAIARSIWEPLPPQVPTATLLSTGIVGSTLQPATQLGELAAWDPIPTGVASDGYVAIIDDASSRVIGFGWAEVTPHADPAQVILTKRVASTANETIAGENATAQLSLAWNTLAALGETERASILEANRTLVHPLVSPVRASTQQGP